MTRRTTLHDLERAMTSYRLALAVHGITECQRYRIMQDTAGIWHIVPAPPIGPDYLGIGKRAALSTLVTVTATLRDTERETS